jgi:putative PIN family toxin of toxin-antitoxin system
MRLIVDANAWVSSLLSSRFHDRLEIVFGSMYRLMVSEQLFRELDRTIRKPHLAKRINREDYEIFVSKLVSCAELVNVRSVVNVCRDPKDNFLLALAKDGNADYLITGDADLTDLKEFGKTKIVTLTEFEAFFH